MKLQQSEYHKQPGSLVTDEQGDFIAACGDATFAADLITRYNAHDDMIAALEAIETLFSDTFYIRKIEGSITNADQERIDKTFQQVADALHAAKGRA